MSEMTENPDATADEAQRVSEESARTLFERDRASQGLGIRIEAIKPGYARLTMPVRADMINGHAVCHGGIVFLLADSAFAFSCNTYNKNTLAAAASIDYLAPAREGDVLTAVARELWRAKRSGIYEVTVSNQRGETIA